VSNARLDLPDPDKPVMTIRRSRGISSEMFLRLWTRAPCTAIVVRADAFGVRDPRGWPPSGAERPRREPGRRETPSLREPDRRDALLGVLEGIAWSRQVEERQLLDVDVTPSRQSDRRRGLADEPTVGKVFTGGRHAAHVEVPLEVVLDFAARPRVARLLQ